MVLPQGLGYPLAKPVAVGKRQQQEWGPAEQDGSEQLLSLQAPSSAVRLPPWLSPQEPGVSDGVNSNGPGPGRASPGPQQVECLMFSRLDSCYQMINESAANHLMSIYHVHSLGALALTN